MHIPLELIIKSMYLRKSLNTCNQLVSTNSTSIRIYMRGTFNFREVLNVPNMHKIQSYTEC